MELGGKHDRSFRETKALGKARQELTVSEYEKKHPGKHVAMSTALGAALGAGLGPKMIEGLRAAKKNITSGNAAGK